MTESNTFQDHPPPGPQISTFQPVSTSGLAAAFLTETNTIFQRHAGTATPSDPRLVLLYVIENVVNAGWSLSS